MEIQGNGDRGMKKARTDWIVMGGEGALCRRCGETEKIPLPMVVDAFGKWAEYFIEKHRYCREKENETP